ncbi:MAG: stage III sporulation protein AE [Clostridia bacterium]|nr:stage III sporulation protein AE [Clostridia bacterium]
MTWNLKKIIIFLLLNVFLVSLLLNFTPVFADQLSENIDEQLGNLELGELENFFNTIVGKPNDVDFLSYINGLLHGEYNVDLANVTNYIANIFLNNVFEVLPTFLSVIAIAVLCGIIQNTKNSYLSDSVGEITFFVCMMGIVLLISTQVISLWQNTQNIIENIANLIEIMSPIIITLMVAVGGNVSASVYKPTVAFLSNGVVNVFLCVVMPLIAMMTIFNLVSNFSSTIKLGKFADFATSTIKWIVGLIVTIFGLFLSVQGITSAHFDGISIKAAKYAISNSVPIIGGFLKDGFDLVIAGSVLIKNVIGIAVIVALFYMVISPALYLAVFSLLLKLTAALVEPISDTRIANFCVSMSKTITYLTVVLLSVGFMLFITVLLMIFSANAFI